MWMMKKACCAVCTVPEVDDYEYSVGVEQEEHVENEEVEVWVVTVSFADDGLNLTMMRDNPVVSDDYDGLELNLEEEPVVVTGHDLSLMLSCVRLAH